MCDKFAKFTGNSRFMAIDLFGDLLKGSGFVREVVTGGYLFVIADIIQQNSVEFMSINKFARGYIKSHLHQIKPHYQFIRSIHSIVI